MLVLAVENGWSTTHLDVTSAFLYGDLEKEVYSLIPEGMNINSHKYVLKLQKSMYGLRVASKNWHSKLCAILKRKGYTPLISEPNVFVDKNEPTGAILLVFVDDFLITGNNQSKINDVINYLETEIEIRNLGPPAKFLGIEITFTSKGLSLHQNPYIDEMVLKYPIGAKQFKTPMEPRLQIEKPEMLQQHISVREILGSLMYASIATRPDITYSTNYLCRYESTPNNEILKYSKRILNYLYTTKHYTLNYVKGSNSMEPTLTLFTDASFASDTVDRKSTTGIIVKFGKNTISWRATKPKCVTRSSSEAEYIAMSQGDAEVRSISNILNELKIKHSVLMFADNTGAIAMCEKRDSRNLKHIDIAYRVVEESIAEGKMKVNHIPGELMEADLLTKSLSKDRHEKLTRLIMNL